MNAKIKAANINEITTSHYTNDLTLDLEGISLNDIKPEDIAKEYPYLDELFEAIIKHDEDMLHDYLEKSGYVFNKA